MGFWSRFARTVRSGRHTDDIEEELQFHLEMDMADGRDRRAARLRLGNVTRIREETRAAGILEWLDSVFRDARYGLRQVSRTPALALAVVLSLAIGIGANTAIFSLVDAAILRPLPVHDAGALRIVVWTSDAFPKNAENINGYFRRTSPTRFEGSSIPAYLYRRLAREQTVFQSLIGVADADAVAAALDAAPAEQVNLQYVSSNFFQGLGTLPVIGRAFRDDEDRVDAPPVVVVSHRFWMRHFGGGPSRPGAATFSTVAFVSTTFRPALSAWRRPASLASEPVSGPMSTHRSLRRSLFVRGRLLARRGSRTTRTGGFSSWRG